MTSYSMAGWPSLRVSPMQQRVLWKPSPLDQEKEGVQRTRLSILMGRSPIFSDDRHLHF